jgi:hypothetical protein
MRHEQAGGGEDHQAEDHRLGGRGAHECEHRLQRRDRRGQQLVAGAGELGHVNPEGRIAQALGEHREHDQPGHDESAVTHAVDLADAPADGRTEHHEVQRRGDHRRRQALPERAPEARHLEQVDGAHAPQVDAIAALIARSPGPRRFPPASSAACSGHETRCRARRSASAAPGCTDCSSPAWYTSRSSAPSVGQLEVPRLEARRNRLELIPAAAA